MILRLFSILFLLYLLGFILFSVTLGQPAGDERTDAAVALTGGSGRIEHGIEVLASGKAKRLLVSGADPAVTKPDLVERLGGKERLVDCCVDLDSVSVDTRSNAEETGRWLDEHGYQSFRLITSDWHMRRARHEFRRVLSDRYEILPDAVRSQPSFRTLFGEYNKLLLRRAAILFEI
ncbi:MAG TPA: YdcF family protein [Sphingomicrobium sp.]|nr:YdcF family protein [Sphingomicrobium sp.]